MKRVYWIVGTFSAGLLCIMLANARSQEGVPVQASAPQDTKTTPSKKVPLSKQAAPALRDAPSVFLSGDRPLGKPPAPEHAAEGVPPKRLAASAWRKITLEIKNPQGDDVDVDVIGVGEFPVSLSVTDDYGSGGDLTRLKEPVDRRAQVCVLVGLKGASRDAQDKIVFKYVSDILVTAAGKSRTELMEAKIPLPPGDYVFQIIVCDPDDPNRTLLSDFSWLPADDPFIPGCIRTGRAGKLRVLPAASTSSKTKAKPKRK